MKHMIHGPCADWCKVNGKCSKRFPKPFQQETTMDKNGYPQYRRRDTGILYEKNGSFVVDNRNVVPYSPTLSTIFNCHVNVEVVSSINAVKYIYKYIYKGNDAASVVIENDAFEKRIDHDEIRDYIEARYVGPVEACWRILSKPLQEKSHAIARVPVHLQNQQSVIINNDLDDAEIRSALQKSTMLLDYIQLNNRDDDAKQYLYSDIPRNYVFKKVTLADGQKVNRWEKRKSFHNVIGRMYSVSPAQTELFSLRILLLNVKGATSYEYLRTVNGEIHQTFTAACLARGLIEDDAEWNRAMNEAKSWMMPRKLRSLFERILIHCQPVYPRDLWEDFKFALSGDYIRRFGHSTGTMRAYSQIKEMLEKEDWELSKFPEMEQITTEFEEEEHEQLLQEISIGQNQYDKLNVKQKEIVDLILRVAERCDTVGKYFYIDGPEGSGKTFVYTTLFYLLKGQGKNICTMAFTGIAATLLPHGKTVHKTLGLSVPLFADSTSNISAQSKEGKRLKEVDVFIWDEAPMAPRFALEVMDRTLRDFMSNDLPFGGKIVVLGGDFRQLLPVNERATRSETVNSSIKFSTLWNCFRKHCLSENMRALPEEKEFSQFLLGMGNGTLNDNSENIQIPDRFIADINSDIVVDTYGDMFKNKQYRFASKHVILSARNIDVDEINRKVINLLDEETEQIYTSIDSTETTGDEGDINHEAILTEYLNPLNPPSLPPHELRLRKYAVIMLLRNLSISEGLCNGTRLLVLEFSPNVWRYEILTGSRAGEMTYLNRITLHCENTYPFSFKRRQFPVKVAFAMTINKSQGQTFDRIGIDLRKDVFNYGQLYVAFSRVRLFWTSGWDSN